MKTKSITRIALGVLIGAFLLVGLVWVLTLTLGNNPQYLYAGKPIEYWREQLNSHDVGASNEAFLVVNRQVITQLTDSMLHDTNDSSLRLSLVSTLNEIPGVQINYFEAGGRRADAARMIGELGPAAESALPALVQVLKGNDAIVHGPAISALGKIHSHSESVIPLLIGYLDNNDLNDEAALALAEYGTLAKVAVPKIIPLLHAPDKDARRAAAEALKKIDPEAYPNATQAPPGMTNGPSVRPGGEGAPPPK